LKGSNWRLFNGTPSNRRPLEAIPEAWISGNTDFRKSMLTEKTPVYTDKPVITVF